MKARYNFFSRLYKIMNHTILALSRRTARFPFLEGMGHAIDLGGTLRRDPYRTSIQSDAEALRNDWEMVGKDMHIAMKEYQ